MKKILIIIPLIFSLGLIGCTGNDESNNQEKETSKVEERKDILPEIKLVLKDMYISINENKDNDKVCREKIEKLNENITDEMIQNEEYKDKLRNLKNYIKNYDLTKISKEVCDILNDMENTDTYKIDLTSTQQKDNINNSENKKSTNKNSESKNNQNKSTNKKKESSTKKTQKCPNCGSTNYNGVVCKDCGFQQADPESCPDCGSLKYNGVMCPDCGFQQSDPPEEENYPEQSEENADHNSQCNNCGSATINDDGTCPYCGYDNY